MTRKSPLNAIYLMCLAFVVTMLLAALGVEGMEGGDGETGGTGGLARGVTRATLNGHPVCYNTR